MVRHDSAREGGTQMVKFARHTLATPVVVDLPTVPGAAGAISARPWPEPARCP
jgi:hypothetical protein